MLADNRKKLDLHIDFQYDPETESPLNDSDFALKTVGAGRNYQLSGLLEDLPKSMQGKTWWVVSCYRHGGEHWFLKEEPIAGIDRWDTTVFAGVLYLKSGDPDKPLADPQEAAREILHKYNEYCDGNCWCYQITFEENIERDGNCPCCGKEGSWIEREYVDYVGAGSVVKIERAIERLVEDLSQFKSDYLENISDYQVSIELDDSSRHYEAEIRMQVRELGFQLAEDTEE